MPKKSSKQNDGKITLADSGVAAEPEKLAAIKQKLQENRNITPLFDTPLFTKNLEAAYIKMMERYQADLQPAQQ